MKRYSEIAKNQNEDTEFVTEQPLAYTQTSILLGFPVEIYINITLHGHLRNRIYFLRLKTWSGIKAGRFEFILTRN